MIKVKQVLHDLTSGESIPEHEKDITEIVNNSAKGRKINQEDIQDSFDNVNRGFMEYFNNELSDTNSGGIYEYRFMGDAIRPVYVGNKDYQTKIDIQGGFINRQYNLKEQPDRYKRNYLFKEQIAHNSFIDEMNRYPNINLNNSQMDPGFNK